MKFTSDRTRCARVFGIAAATACGFAMVVAAQPTLPPGSNIGPTIPPKTTPAPIPPCTSPINQLSNAKLENWTPSVLMPHGTYYLAADDFSAPVAGAYELCSVKARMIGPLNQAAPCSDPSLSFELRVFSDQTINTPHGPVYRPGLLTKLVTSASSVRGVRSFSQNNVTMIEYEVEFVFSRGAAPIANGRNWVSVSARHSQPWYLAEKGDGRPVSGCPGVWCSGSNFVSSVWTHSPEFWFDFAVAATIRAR